MGQAERPNGAFGKSDIEAKTARVAASELGKERVSKEQEQVSQSPHTGGQAVRWRRTRGSIPECGKTNEEAKKQEPERK